MKLTESTIRKIVENAVSEIIGTDAGLDIEGEIYDILNYCGWAYFNSIDRPEGTTYVCHEDDGSNNPVSWDDVKKALSDVFGSKVGFGTATSKNAPEIKYNTFTIKNDGLNEISNRTLYRAADKSTTGDCEDMLDNLRLVKKSLGYWAEDGSGQARNLIRNVEEIEAFYLRKLKQGTFFNDEFDKRAQNMTDAEYLDATDGF